MQSSDSIIKLRSIRDVDVSGKNVLLRASLNEPVASDGSVADSFRLHQALKTIEYLSARGAKIIVIAHLGRNGDTLAPVALALASLTNVPITFCAKSLRESHPDAEALKYGECVILENIRRDAGEENNELPLSAELALFGDIYVNDAFADSHRAHASIVGVSKLLPAYAGLLMEEEVQRLSPALKPTVGALAIVGGAKWETKEPLIHTLLKKYSHVCVGGMLANDVLKARGQKVGSSVVSDASMAEDVIKNEHLVAPSDLIVVKVGETSGRTTAQAEEGERIVDIGPSTVHTWSELVYAAPFILWNGPLGIYEEGFVDGTKEIARAIAGLREPATAIIGGGDTIAVVREVGVEQFDQSRIFLSTGGGAMLKFITDGMLVGVEPLLDHKD